MRLPLSQPAPDINRLCAVIRGEIIPDRPPLIELIIDRDVQQQIAEQLLGLPWPDPKGGLEAERIYYRSMAQVWWRMGYDMVRLSGPVSFPTRSRDTEDTAGSGRRRWDEENMGMISNWEEFEQYPWPDPETVDLHQYELLAEELPEGMGLFICPRSGFFEVPLSNLLGYQNLCYLLYDDPELVDAVFQRCGQILYRLYERCIGLPRVAGFFSGDDMGFRTGPLVGLDHLRRLVLPWHQRVAELAHAHGLLFLLHSCGQIDALIDDLIDTVGIDGRHSFDDAANPVIDAKKLYGHRTAILGGLDVHKLATYDEAGVRQLTRLTIDACAPGGRFAIGTGNSVCNYIPMPNYLAMLETALA